MPPAVFILANGARTPLGLRAAPSAAALRAGISGVSERPVLSARPWTPKLAALDAELDATLTGPERLLAMAQTAIREACTRLEGSRADLRVSLYLCLPELRPGFTGRDAEFVRSGLLRCKGLAVELVEVNIFTDGHAAGFAALAAAVNRIQQGALDACLVGGADSYFHQDTLEWLDSSRQLAGGDARSAFVPGEGAGFCLLASERMHDSLGMAALMRVVSVGVGKESRLIKTEDICLGEGLANAVQTAVAGLPAGTRIDEVICDVNGERYRSEEWGFVCLRLSHCFTDPTAYLSPADCWGDVGAASMPLFAMLACQAAAGGYARGSRTLLWASSEQGLRGAAVLETINTA